jgi:hypothetical protein
LGPGKALNVNLKKRSEGVTKTQAEKLSFGIFSSFPKMEAGSRASIDVGFFKQIHSPNL